MRFATKAIHLGQEPDPATGAVTLPIHPSSTYLQKEPGKEGEYVYSRTGNPTRRGLERSIAALEEAEYGLAFASGMAAISAVGALLKRGDHVLVCDDVYGGTYRLFDKLLKPMGIEFTYSDLTDPTSVERGLRKGTRMIWLESPTNPLLKLIDLEGASRVARGAGALVVVDNTFMSPALQRPLPLGADIVLHSTTKYIGGHSDLVGGVLATSKPKLYLRLKFIQNAVGAVPSSFDCWLALRGVKTLALRMERHSSNAQRVAQFLEAHPKVERVFYPGLAGHPQHGLALRQMEGFGGMVSFEVKGGFKACRRLLTSLRTIYLAESLGGVESLIEHPATMTHASIPPTRRRRLGITEGLIRMSVGIEAVEDLIEDLEQGFRKV